MGQGLTSSFKDELKIDEKEWQLPKYQSGLKIVPNNKTNIEAQFQLVYCQPQHTIQRQLEIYYYRKMQKNALVTVYAAEHLKNIEAPLCASIQTIKVIHQKIPSTLSNIRQLIFAQSLYVLSQALRGFSDCYQKVGLFQVTESMIGVNSAGQVRVWLNQNFAKNHPPQQKVFLQITASDRLKQSAFDQEKIFLGSVIKIIQKKMQQGRFPKDFQEIIYKQKTFADAYCQIQTYCNQKHLWIPDHLPLNILQSHRRSISKFSQSKSHSVKRAELKASYHSSVSHSSYNPNPHCPHPRIKLVEKQIKPFETPQRKNCIRDQLLQQRMDAPFSLIYPQTIPSSKGNKNHQYLRVHQLRSSNRSYNPKY